MCIVIAERRKAKGKSFKFDYQPNQRKELSMSRIFKGSCGYDIVARYEDGKVYEGNFGCHIIGRYEGGARSGAAAAAFFSVL